VLDGDRLRRNVARMRDKMNVHGVAAKSYFPISYVAFGSTSKLQHIQKLCRGESCFKLASKDDGWEGDFVF